MDQALRILLVEDQATDAELLQRELRRGGYEFTAKRVYTSESFQSALSEFIPDLILSDFSMPTFDGLSALVLARTHAPETPFIFVSGTIGEDRALEALRNGATDYVLKDRPKRLLSAVERALADVKKRAALRSSQQALGASEDRFRSFMQYLPARASIRDLEGHYTFVNENWQRAAGLKSADVDVLGSVLEDAPSSDRAAELNSYHRQVIETFKPVSRIYRYGPEGKWWFSTYFPIPDIKGNVGMIGTVAIDITEQKTQEERLNYLAYYDPLTGLPNRALFLERLGQLLQETTQKKTALVVLNVNRFGIVNESLGHSAGDTLLRELASRLRSTWPDPGQVARPSAECFAGVLTDVTDDANIAHVLDDLLEKVFAFPFVVDGKELTVSMTSGIAIAPMDGGDVDTLLRNAEAALKQAKTLSARYAYYQPAMNATVTQTLMLENKLRRALDHGHLDLHYQPKVCVATGDIVGLEALMRWNDPELGPVSPARFIPLLEETGLILEVGQWAVVRAMNDFRTWQEEGLQPPRIAVNVSTIQLAQEDYLDALRCTVNDIGAESHGLDIEITESLLMADIVGNMEKLRAIRKMGINISIDDFGTGYSSLGYLAKLPVNALKIDRSFVISMADDADSMAIVSTIVSLAHSLGLKVIAEGVETEEQRQLLKLLKCDEIQGYLFHKPLPVNQMTTLLRSKCSAVRDK